MAAKVEAAFPVGYTPRVTLDFDGVINSYPPGEWEPNKVGSPPTAGAREAIAVMRAQGYEVVVLSARAREPGGNEAIEAWLEEHGIEVDAVVDEKLPSEVYVDDRGYRFDGNWAPLLAFLKGDTRPWNRR